MKIPKAPPEYLALAARIAKSGRFGAVMLRIGQLADPGYLHWDELRYGEPLRDLTHEEWWFLARTARTAASKPLPLVDTRQQPFIVVSSHERVAEALHDIDTRAGVAVKLAEPFINPAKRSDYILRSLMEEAITSSQLGGAATTRDVARAMLRTQRPPRDRGERMIFNNFATMRRIRALRHAVLTPALVFELHGLVTADALDKGDGAGRFRRPNEDITVAAADGQRLHQPPPAEGLAQRLEAMCAFANGETPASFIHPVIRAVALHFWLAWDHPFVDGNGRTARALFYWCMLKQGYWMTEYISISEIILKAPAKYGRAYLLTETDSNDFTYFLIYHLEVIKASVDRLHANLDVQVDRSRSARALLALAAGWCNPRQSAVLELLLEDPETTLSIAQHQETHGIVYETARTDLLELEARGLISKSKAGRKLVFRAAQDLETRLQDPALGVPTRGHR